jgi:hypothetical protein
MRFRKSRPFPDDRKTRNLSGARTRKGGHCSGEYDSTRSKTTLTRSFSFFCVALWSIDAVLYVKQPGVAPVQHQLRPGSSQPCDYTLPDNLSIMALFRNEADYRTEWIEYHSLVDAQRF